MSTGGQELVQQKLLGTRADVVGFVDDLLLLASQVGQIHCVFIEDRRLLRLEIPGEEPWEVSMALAKGRLRSACARLGVPSIKSGHDVSLYGGEGVIVKPAVSSLANGPANRKNATWHVRFKNTPDAQEFTITAVEDTSPCQ
jgi:hypothetical protein